MLSFFRTVFIRLRLLISKAFRLPLRAVLTIFVVNAACFIQLAKADTTNNIAVSQVRENDCQPEFIATPTLIPHQGTQNEAYSDAISKKSGQKYTLEGDVLINQPGLVVKANQVHINREQQTIQAIGHVELHTKDIVLTGKQADINQADNTAKLQGSQYQVPNSFAHGSAKQIDIEKNNLQTFLKESSFTTCKLDKLTWQARPNQLKTAETYDWTLNFGLLEIDDAKQRMYGKNTVLRFQDIPVFYTPYISFPTNDRASGLLFPTFGSYKSITQDTPETYLSVPVYINLSPQMDDTVTYTRMQDRGNLFGNEFRYKQPKHSATLTTNFIQDNLTRKEGIASVNSNGNIIYSAPVSERWDAKLVAQQNWGPGLNSTLNWREVSDKNFYADLPVDTTLSTRSTVERNANLTYNANDLTAHISLLDYLRLRNNAAYNYTKRPEIGLQYGHYFEQKALVGLGFNMATEATQFKTSHAEAQKPEALRVYIAPSVEYSVIKPFGNLKSEVVYNKVHYGMEDNGYNNTGANTHNINVPQFAIRGGLTFEKNWGNSHITQTLEPEIQYLYVPYQNQSNIPVFDTRIQSLDFSNLFSYNRFSGYDRIGDTNQVSAALTTKLLDTTGAQIAVAGLGQIFYLEDRKVQLTGSNIDTSRVSDYFVKGGLQLGSFSLNSTAQFSNENYELTNANSRLKTQMNKDFIFLMTHTLTNHNLPSKKEDMSVGFNWQMNNQWALGYYSDYDFIANRKTENRTAIRYDSCCWASELSVKETQLAGGLYNYSIQYFIELKGLSSMGTPFSRYLTNKLNF